VWDDPHNADPSFQRVRLRREVLPLLEDVLQGGVAEALARTAALVRDDLDALDSLDSLDSRIDHDVDAALQAADLAGRPRAIRTRLLRAWCAAAGVPPLAAGHLGSLDALVVKWHGQGPVDLPGGRRVRRVSGRIEFIPPAPHLPEPVS
jgi:tRNA(Ile)-lysidine synthase